MQALAAHTLYTAQTAGRPQEYSVSGHGGQASGGQAAGLYRNVYKNSMLYRERIACFSLGMHI
jgi:hypothetical protein